MNNKSVSDFVAATMDAVLKSQEHNSLFNTTYKFASDENSAETMEDSNEDSCSANDDIEADDNDAETVEVFEEDTSDADDLNAGLYDVSANYDVAIDSLLTASAALDSVGLERSSTVSLKLASLVLEAKKKETAKETSKSKDTKGKKDSGAKDKKETSSKGKKDPKKTDSNKDKSGKSTKKPTSSKPAVTSTTKPKGKDNKSSKPGKTNPFAKKSK